jgi:hypothetical protein
MDRFGGWDRWKTGLVVALAAATGIVWIVRLNGQSSFDAREFRDTEGIESEVIGVAHSERGYHVRCRVANRRQQAAEQVVLTVTIVGSDGSTLAQNPLVSVSDLGPGTSRETDVLLPDRAPVHGNTGKVEVSLVRWTPD